MKLRKHMISRVLPDSIAEELGLEPGDRLVSVNGQPVEDVFDYRYLMNEELVVLLVEKPDGEEWELEVEKEYEEDLGIEFENGGLMDDYRSCSNKCMFCFIDQMPPGMRETLYFKDDDSRLSFLQGNYVTLTNMSEKDIERVIRYHLEPINISFQAMNPELRCKMLHNRFAGKALDKVDMLYNAGITMNGQIVLCKGVNDGDELEYSLEKLSAYAAAYTEALRKEYTGSDEGITVTVEEEGQGTEPVLHPVSQEKALFFLLNYPNGIQKMCGFIDGLVETSCNVGITKLTPAVLSCSASVRSSVGTAKKALADKIGYLTEFLGGTFTIEGEYPAWEFKQDSKLRQVLVDVYEEMYQKEPVVNVIHAGLECGLFYEKIAGLDCVSIGPDMQDIHTSEEKLSISSVERVWNYLLEVLKRIKE